MTHLSFHNLPLISPLPPPPPSPSLPFLSLSLPPPPIAMQVVERVAPPYLPFTLTNESVLQLPEAQLLEPYTLVDGECNEWMSDMPSTLERYLFVVNYLAHNGFYVAAVQQTNNEPMTPVGTCRRARTHAHAGMRT